jgi:hypothetical protein
MAPPTATSSAPGTSTWPATAPVGTPSAAVWTAAALRSAGSERRRSGPSAVPVPLTGDGSLTSQLQASVPWLPAAPSPMTVTAPTAGDRSPADSSRMSVPRAKVRDGGPAAGGAIVTSPSGVTKARQPDSAASSAICVQPPRRSSTTK